MDVQGLFRLSVEFESFGMIMSVPLKDSFGRAPVTGVRNWQEVQRNANCNSMVVLECNVLAKVTGALLCAEEWRDELELPAQRGADAEVVLVGSHWWLAVEVFVHVKSPPKILHDFYAQVGSGL